MNRRRISPSLTLAAAVLAANASIAGAQTIAIEARWIHTMAGAPIRDGAILITDGRIRAIGPIDAVAVPVGTTVLRAEVATPGLVDAHTVVGLSGRLNQEHDQDQLDDAEPIQPELRAIDAYDAREPLVEWVRSLGVTTIHTGHGPGQVISGQTMIAKTGADTMERAVMVPVAMVAATIGEGATGERDSKKPGTRAKAVATLRTQFVKAREYVDKLADEDPAKRPARDLRLETLARVLSGEIPLLVTAHRHHDILTALRLQREFGFRLVLDGAAEVYEVLDEVKAAAVPLILHPTMARANGERQNLSMSTAARLHEAGVLFAIQSGYESYVPKARVVLFEAGQAAGRGLAPERALAAITIDAARILGVADRVGSLEVGKDGDVALFDGDPLEYTTHCVGVVIEGRVESTIRR